MESTIYENEDATLEYWVVDHTRRRCVELTTALESREEDVVPRLNRRYGRGALDGHFYSYRLANSVIQVRALTVGPGFSLGVSADPCRPFERRYWTALKVHSVHTQRSGGGPEYPCSLLDAYHLIIDTYMEVVITTGTTYDQTRAKILEPKLRAATARVTR